MVFKRVFTCVTPFILLALSLVAYYLHFAR